MTFLRTIPWLIPSLVMVEGLSGRASTAFLFAYAATAALVVYFLYDMTTYLRSQTAPLLKIDPPSPRPDRPYAERFRYQGSERFRVESEQPPASAYEEEPLFPVAVGAMTAFALAVVAYLVSIVVVRTAVEANAVSPLTDAVGLDLLVRFVELSVSVFRILGATLFEPLTGLDRREAVILVGLLVLPFAVLLRMAASLAELSERVHRTLLKRLVTAGYPIIGNELGGLLLFAVVYSVVWLLFV